MLLFLFEGLNRIQTFANDGFNSTGFLFFKSAKNIPQRNVDGEVDGFESGAIWQLKADIDAGAGAAATGAYFGGWDEF